MKKYIAFIKDKKFIFGLILGYLITSYMNLEFPGIYFWSLLGLGLIISSWIWFRWSKMNEDYYDF